MPDDPDQLLALALARVPHRHLWRVRTRDDILRRAREARALAFEVRQELVATRQRSAAALAGAVMVRERLQVR